MYRLFPFFVIASASGSTSFTFVRSRLACLEKNVKLPNSSSALAFRRPSRSSSRFGYHLSWAGLLQKLSAHAHLEIQLYASSKTSSDEVSNDFGVRDQVTCGSDLI